MLFIIHKDMALKTGHPSDIKVKKIVRVSAVLKIIPDNIKMNILNLGSDNAPQNS